MLLPLSVWAMTPISDSQLSNVTGQAGVNINADVTMDVSIGTMAWGDADGIASVYNPWVDAGTTTGGYVGMKNFNITNLKIRARTEAGDNYGAIPYSTLMLKPITIDVATGTKLGVAGTTFVRFGLGALQISLDQLQFDVALGDRTLDASGNVVLDQEMGQVTLGAMDIYINPYSYVDIFAHAGSGVDFELNVTLDKVNLPFISWGDTDGLPGGSTNAGGTKWMSDGTAGYVGLNNFKVGSITMNGTVAIDVTTTASGVYAQLPVLISAMQSHGLPIYNEAAVAAYIASNGLGTLSLDQLIAANSLGALVAPVSVVHISFPTDFNLNVGKITGDVTLSNAAQLNGTSSAVMGDIYIQGLGLTVKQGSWVDIWAH
jgi:hypothetical protein